MSSSVIIGRYKKERLCDNFGKWEETQELLIQMKRIRAR